MQTSAAADACACRCPDCCLPAHLLPVRLTAAAQPILHSLLPAVCEVISTNAESGDTRFFCLRMVSEVTQLYLMDPELYGGQATGRSQGSQTQGQGVATTVIDTLLRQHVFPTIPKLLQDEDPMPLYALKVTHWPGNA